MIHIPPAVLEAVLSVAAAAAVYALHKLSAFLQAKTDSVRGDAALASADEILSDLVVQLAPEIAKDLADGKIDDDEAKGLLDTAKALLGTKGLEALGKVLGLDTSGVESWLANKLGASAAVKQATGLPPFYASPEMSAKMKAGEVK